MVGDLNNELNLKTVFLSVYIALYIVDITSNKLLRVKIC